MVGRELTQSEAIEGSVGMLAFRASAGFYASHWSGEVKSRSVTQDCALAAREIAVGFPCRRWVDLIYFRMHLYWIRDVDGRVLCLVSHRLTR